MNPIESVASVLRNLLNFSGRATRAEFWWSLLVALVLALALTSRLSGVWFWSWFIWEFLYLLFSLALILPVLYLVLLPAATVRRLHDTGRSARWLLICIVIVLGWGAIGGVMALAAYSDDGWGPLILGLIMGGIWVLISLVGLTALTIALALPGTSGPNRYGPDLLRPESADNSVPQAAPATEFPPGAGGSARSVDDQASPDISAGPDAPARQYCIQCGTQLQQDARFCVSCGTPI